MSPIPLLSRKWIDIHKSFLQADTLSFSNGCTRIFTYGQNHLIVLPQMVLSLKLSVPPLWGYSDFECLMAF